jgi:hypothetical protein
MKALLQIVSCVMLLGTTTSCGLRCVGLDCAVAPMADVNFEFKNGQGENLLTTGQFTLEDITFVRKSTQESFPLDLNEDKVNADFFFGYTDYTLAIGGTNFEIEAIVEEVDDGDCCSSFRLKSLAIDGVAIAPLSPGLTVTLVL